ncbi:MAG: hypothetical protein H6712_20765 [Myxococcales bacterium]|nr:hypothetical protein [Myxococcales bacterium]MCB9716308.1 hypothetical protein [Myxococcales bacterium]
MLRFIRRRLEDRIVASEFCKRKYSALFEHLDNNRDGAIDVDDWHRHADFIQAETGWTADDPRLSSLLEATDAWWGAMQEAFGQTDGSRISKAQFLSFCDDLAEQLRAGGSPPEWAVEMCTRTHQMLDVSGNGVIDPDEYGLWLRAIGSKADPREVFLVLDLDSDGVVDRDEMLVLFRQFLVSEDPVDPGNYLMTGTI